MKLFIFLQNRIPRTAAIVLTALWFAALMILAFFFANEPQAEFRYGNL